MKLNSPIYPYPVLSNNNDDFVDSQFKVKYNVLTNNNVSIMYVLENEELEELILKGKAVVVLHVECSHTSIRNIYYFEEKMIELNIDSERFQNKIEVNTVIICNEEIVEYTNCKFNQDYYGNDYIVRNLPKGSILATTNTEVIKIQQKKNSDDDISSIIRISASSDIKSMVVNLDGNIISVRLPNSLFNEYVKYNGNHLQSSVLGFIVLPVLIYVLDEIEKVPEDDLDQDWYESIKQILEDKGYDISKINDNPEHNSIVLAQVLLDNPIERAFNDLNKMEVDDE